MKKILALLVLIAATVFTNCTYAQQPVDYRTAYENAQKGDKPLLVLVTAEWCPPVRS